MVPNLSGGHFSTAFDNIFLQHITSIRSSNYYTSLFIAVFCGDEYNSHSNISPNLTHALEFYAKEAMRFHNVDVLRYRHTYQEYSHRTTTDNNGPQNITVFVSLYTSNMQERQSVKILTFWVLPSRTQLPELLAGYSTNCFIKTFSTLDSFLSESSPSLLIQRSLPRNITPLFMTHDVAPGDCCGHHAELEARPELTLF